MTTIPIRLPRPHGQQIRFEKSKAKRKVIVAGRRSGKTTGLAMLAVKAMLAGWRVLEAAPVSDQTNAFWENCKKFLAGPIAQGIVYKNESDRVLQLPSTPLHVGRNPSPMLVKELGIADIPTSPRIKAKTAWNADTLRGDWADLLLLDEYSIMSPTVWSEVGAPMLLDNDGIAIFSFTPKRKNHAYKHYVRGLTDETGRWESFHFSSFVNPHLNRVALEEITFDLTEDMYEQEILAKFLDNDGVVFRNVVSQTKGSKSDPSFHQGHKIIMGGDWGQQVDYTALSVGCLTCHKEVDHDRFRRISYELQKVRLKALHNKWNCDSILLELNSVGLPLFQSLEEAGLPVVGFDTTGVSKPKLIQNLQLVLEAKEWMFIDDPVWTVELEAYEQTISPTTGRSSYGAPEGMHDDTVIGRALMVSPDAERTALFDVF